MTDVTDGSAQLQTSLAGMTDTTIAPTDAPTAATAPDSRRWLALAVIAVAQLMIVVDATIVNVALPSAQRGLHISVANRQWVVTAYTLAFGGLLLLGGRIADYVGRKPIFIIGLLGFAASSAIGGLAPDAAVLFASRALQGGFAAIMAPAALSLLTVTFTDPRERARAFGVYGGIAGGGAAIGLIAGGVLTEYASWRWCLLVNAPIALITAIAAMRLVTNSKAEGRARYDVLGALTATGGLTALVFGFTEADTDGWSSAVTLSLLVVGVVALAAFVAVERRATQPLLPLRVITERNRGGSYLANLLAPFAMFGMFLFLTYYLQGVQGYSPLSTGFAFLPFSVGIVISAVAASALMTRTSPRLLMTVGLAMAIVGIVWFTTITPHASYAVHILPGEIIMSLGLGLVFVPVSNVALFGIDPADAGVASALVNTTQQVGGAIGTAVLNTVAATATASYLAAHGGPSRLAAQLAGSVHGYTVAFWVGAAVLAAALVVAVAAVRITRRELAEHTAEAPLPVA